MTDALEGLVGRPLKALHGRRYVLGSGRYVDDLRSEDCLWAAFVRSPHPHARIRGIDIGAARATPGVVAIVVGNELAQVGQIPVNRFAAAMQVPEYRALSGEIVRYVGEPIAAVVAETRPQAEDACRMVEIQFEPLQAVVSAQDALGPEAPLVHPELGSNVCYRLDSQGGAVDAGMARAASIVRVQVAHHRIAAVALEPRGLLAHFDRGSGELTVQAASQTPHQLRDDLAAALGLPQHRVRVIVPDLGGGFGSKGSTYREDVAVAALALQLGRAVRWTATRAEDFQSTQHARDQVDSAEAGFDPDGRILALRTRTVCNLGAFVLGRSSRQALRVASFGTGAYQIPAHQAETVTVFTNTTPTGAYRGAGRPEAAFLIERLMDAAAHELGIDPTELRRRNFVQPGEFPHVTPNGATYDSGDYPALLDRLLELADYEGLRRVQAARRARGELVGIGFATFVENTSAGWESGRVRVEADGNVTASSGAVPMGQGVETVLAQIVADTLGMPIDRVAVRCGDTAWTQVGMGSFGSRSTAVAGSALLQAAERVRARAAQIAAARLEVGPDDLEFAGGVIRIIGAPERFVTWAALGQAAYPPLGRPILSEPGLEEQAFFGTDGEAISAGAYLALVSVEAATGQVRLEQLVAVDDCGTVVNPLLLEGQLHGAIAQGIGEVLQERIVYDAAGQLSTGSLLDYALPTARQVIAPLMAQQVTPSPLNPLGAKGAGEAGIIGTPPAVLNAVLDALAPLGVRQLDPPLHPEKIWRALRAGGASQG